MTRSCSTFAPSSRRMTSASGARFATCWSSRTSARGPDPMTTAVIGTGRDIAHGKTALLRALTGIDADRLPEEKARGMTLDVGYAHLALEDRVGVDLLVCP